MITQMQVISTQPDIPELPIGNSFMPNDNPVQIRNIDGLGPSKSEIASTPFATGRGSLFQGSSTANRNIVLTLGLNPDWQDQTIGSLRQLLYRYFMTEFWTELHFYSDELPEVWIKGVVESCEPNIFSQDPEMQVSIICPKPDFIDDDTTLITGGSMPIAGMDFSTLDFDTMDETAEPRIEYINYIGTAPTGFELRIERESVPYSGPITIVNATPDGVQILELTGVLINPTQRFELTTVRSIRGVYNILVSTDDAINILAKMVKASDWPEFFPGANKFGVYMNHGAIIELPWTLQYFNRFGGL